MESLGGRLKGRLLQKPPSAKALVGRVVVFAPSTILTPLCIPDVAVQDFSQQVQEIHEDCC